MLISLMLVLPLGVAVSFIQPPAPAEALTVDAFSQTSSTKVHGDFILAGNGVLTCDGNPANYYWTDRASRWKVTGTATWNYLDTTAKKATFAQTACAALHTGQSLDIYDGYSTTSGAPVNDYFKMSYVGGTTNASQAKISLPADAPIKSATLFWSASTGLTGNNINDCGRGSGTATRPDTVSGFKTQKVTIQAGNLGQVSVAPTNVITDDDSLVASQSDQASYYSARADVTAALQGLATGSQQTVTVGNIWAPQGYGCYGGWALEVIYDYGAYVPGNTSSTLKAIYDFDGYVRTYKGDSGADILLNGLNIEGGLARAGLVGYEGDRGISGDYVRYTDYVGSRVGTSAYDLANPNIADKPQNNMFVGWGEGSVPFPTLSSGTPFLNNSVDATILDMPALVWGDTALQLQLNTTQDSYLLQHVAVSVPLPEIAVTKTSLLGDPDQSILPGGVPEFKITVYNSGAVNLLNLRSYEPTPELQKLAPDCTKTPEQMQALLELAYPSTHQIPPGGSVQYTCKGTSTNATYTNTIQAEGDTPNNVHVTTSDDAKVLVATWNATKTSDQKDVPIGTEATWTITVKNTGSSDIWDIKVTDPQFPKCSTTIKQLVAGQDYSYKCTGVITGTTTNSVTVTGTAKPTETSKNSVTMPPISSTAPPVQVSGVSLKKTANKTVVNAGDPVTFTFLVTNTGTSTLNSWSVTDPNFPSCAKTVTQPLGPGQSTSYTCSVTPFPQPSSTVVVNSATVTATPPSGTKVTASSQVGVDSKSMSMTKNVVRTNDVNGNNALDDGDTVLYSFSLTNTGSATLTNSTVTDGKLPGATITCSPGTIPAGQTATCTTSALYTVTLADVDAGTLKNTATGTATAPDGSTTTATASTTLTPNQKPAISLAKTASPLTGVKKGDTVTYTFVATNTGNATLNGVAISDPLTGLSALSCRNEAGAVVTQPTSLLPNAKLTCTATYTTTQANVDAGTWKNTASVTGTSTKGSVVNSTADATVTADRSASATFTKEVSTPSMTKAGQVITFTYTFVNTGTTTLTSVQPTDPAPGLGNRTCTPSVPATVAPGGKIVCSATMVVTQAHMDGGAITNTASYTAALQPGMLGPDGTNILKGSDSKVVTPATSPGLAIMKSATRTEITAVGQDITYSYQVTNSGNTTVSNVRVADPMPGLGTITCSPAQGSTLTPGGVMSCSATYRTTQADMDRKATIAPVPQLSNTATATGKDSHGQALSKSTTLDIPITQTPAIYLSKGVTPSTLTKPGLVTYTFVVQNKGNVTLSNLQLSDALVTGVTCTPVAIGGSLAPGGQTTCTATYEVKQAQIDKGSFTNTATVAGTSPDGAVVTSPSSAKLTITQSPDFTIAKEPTPQEITAPLQDVTYRVTVTNTGNVTMTNLRVVDPKISLWQSCAPVALGGELAPSTSTVCTGVYKSTQAEYDGGSITNTATATLTPPTGPDITREKSATVTTVRTPEIQMTKTSSVGTYTKVGDQITYTMKATNSGNVSLNNVRISDPMFTAAQMSCTPASGSTLAPGAFMTCTATRTATQADLDEGTISNRASASGTGTNGAVVTGDATKTVNAVIVSGAKLTKTPTPGTIDKAGTPITYSIVYTNTSNVTLNNVQIVDAKIPTFSNCSPVLGSKLAPNASMTCTGTYVPTQAEVDAGSITNTATGTGALPMGGPVDASNSATVTVNQTPSLTLTKRATPDRASTVGEKITYSFDVVNTGNVTAQGIAVTDPMPGLSGITCVATTLKPTEKTTCTATYTLTQKDLNLASGKMPNEATVTATTTDGKAFTPVKASTSVTMVQNPLLTIEKVASVTTVKTVGDPITYTITVKNAGNVDITGVQVTDTMFTPAQLSCTPAVGATLKPTETMTCTATKATSLADLNSGKIVNTASATGTKPDGTSLAKVTSQATVTATQNASFTFVKKAAEATIANAGDIIHYTFVVTNSGNVTLGSLKVTDPMSAKGLSSISCPVTSLNPGESTTCTATYVAKLADIDAGSVPNSASASMEKPGGNPNDPTDNLTQDSSTSVGVAQKPGLTLKKTPNTTQYSKVGQVISYSFEATNSGNVTLTDVRIEDAMPGLSGLTGCTAATLKPSEKLACSATYTVTQDDIDKTTLTNSATATGTAPDKTTVKDAKSVVLTAALDPRMTLTKSGSPNPVGKSGEAITFSFVVTNVGNVRMDAIAVTDPMVGPVTCPVTTLAPGTSTTCTGTYTVTLADMDKGTIDNTATLDAKDPSGTAMKQISATTQIKTSQAPKLQVTKTATPTTVDALGQAVTYGFTVKNIGNVTVNAIVLKDPRLGTTPVTCAPTSLAPGESATCSAEYKVTQTDLDKGSITNTATATGTTATSTVVPEATSNTVTVAVTQKPNFSITKKVDLTSVSAVGTQLTYTVRVTNTGNVTLGNALVVDPLPDRSSMVCWIHDSAGVQLRGGTGSVSLSPGEYKECTYTYNVKQSDLDTGSILNTATVTPTAPDPATGSSKALDPQSANAVVTAEQKASFTLTKAADTTTYSAVGQTVTYNYTITNTGNTTLHNLTLSDDHAGLSAFTCTPALSGTLAPKASLNCSATYTVTQADLDRLTVVNKATATATVPPTAANPTPAPIPDTAPDPVTGKTDHTATVTIKAVTNPAMTVAKSVDKQTVRDAGTLVTYTVRVSNTGNVTLTNGALVDPMAGLSAWDCGGVTTMAPGAFVDCTATKTITQTDINAGTLVNTATATATSPDKKSVSGSSQATVTMTQDPKLTIEKAALPMVISTAGEVVTYSFLVTNVGNVTISGVTVTDPLKGLSGVTCPATPIDPGKSLTCTATLVATQPDIDRGSITNTARATGTTTSKTPVPPAGSNTVTVKVDQKPDWTFDKSSTTASVKAVGDIVNYEFRVTNTGNLTISNVDITDDLKGLNTPTCSIYSSATSQVLRPGYGPVSVGPGEYKLCKATYSVTQADIDAGAVKNHAFVNANKPDGSVMPVVEDDNSVPAVQASAFTFTKSASVTEVTAANQKITYSFLLTNTGNTTLTNPQISDPHLLTAPTCTPALGTSLAPKASMRCTADYTVTQADMDRADKTIHNEATATATGPEKSLTSTSAKDVQVKSMPAMTVAKQATPTKVAKAGDTITYTVTVTNTGNVTLTNGKLVDPMPGLSAFDCGAVTTIAPTASATCTATKVVTQAEFDKGSLSNTATATGTAPDGTPIQKSGGTNVTMDLRPTLKVTKTANVQQVQTVGDVIVYTFTVENTGNVTVNEVGVVDQKISPDGPLNCDKTVLAPGEVTSCEHVYTVTQPDIDHGSVENVATASGSTTAGVPVQPSEGKSSVPVLWKPSLSFTKVADKSTVTRIGDTVTYTLTVTNTGNVTLKGVFMKDPTAWYVDAGKNLVTKSQYPALTEAEAKAMGLTLLGGPQGQLLVRCSIDGVDSPSAATLEPGQTKVCHWDERFTQEDFEVRDPNTGTKDPADGSPLLDYTNQAYVDGKTPDGTPIERVFSSPAKGAPAAPTAVLLDPSPDFTMTKTANTQAYRYIGQEITYQIVAENSGNVALNDVTIIDTKLKDVNFSCSPAKGSTLQPGQKMMCTGTYKVTDEDMKAGAITNSASGTGKDNQGTVHTASAAAVLTVKYDGATGIQVDKSATPSNISMPGTPITYTFVLTNLGMPEVTGVKLEDTMLAAAGSTITCTSGTKHGIPETIDPSNPTIPANVDDQSTESTKGIPLQPYSQTICTATYTATQADVDSGKIINNVTLTGTQGGEGKSSSSSYTVSASHVPSLSVTKTADKPSVSTLGEVVTYSFLVKNTGNLVLKDVAVNDTLTGLSGITCPLTTLYPAGQTDANGQPLPSETTCTATLPVSQDHLNGPSIKNTATATGAVSAPGAADDGQKITSSPDTATVEVTWNPKMTLTKKADKAQVSTIGEKVVYTFVATNTGNVRLDGITLADQLKGLSSVACTKAGKPLTLPAALSPQEQFTCTASYNVTQTDIDAGSIKNTATLNATKPDSVDIDPVPASAAVTATQTPKLEIAKAVDKTEYSQVGEPITYTITVTNTGNTTVNQVAVTDAMPGLTLSCSPAMGSELPAGNKMTCTGTHTVTQEDLDLPVVDPKNGPLRNVATVTGVANTTNATQVTASSNEVASTPVVTPKVDLVKSSTTTVINTAGQKVPYTFVATNIGTATLYDVTITDTLPGIELTGCTGGTIKPGETFTCKGTYTVQQADIDYGYPNPLQALPPLGTLTNTASVTGHDINNTQATDTTSIEIPIDQVPAVKLAKSASTGKTDVNGKPMVDAVGDVVTYTFTITNIGNTLLASGSITDQMPGLQMGTCGDKQIPVGETITCQGTLTITQTHLDGGTFSNVAYAVGKSLDGEYTNQASAAAEVVVAQKPELTFEKTATPTVASAIGDPITYTFVTKNTGNVMVFGGILDDPKISGLSRSCTKTDKDGKVTAGVMAPLDVAPGTTITCTATRALTREDVDAGSLTNTATVSGKAPDSSTVTSKPSSATVEIKENPVIKVEKSQDRSTFSAVGDKIGYTFVVTNEGNVTLKGVKVTDVMTSGDPTTLSALACTPAQGSDLGAGDKMTCTATKTITQADLDGLKVDNGATVTSTSPNGTVTEDSTDTPVTATAVITSSIDLTKSADLPNYDRAGQIVTYTMTAKNTGTSTLTGVTITDPMPNLSALTCTVDGVAVAHPLPSLAPGKTLDCRASYTVTQDDVDFGNPKTGVGVIPRIVNTATVHALDPNKIDVTDSDTNSLSVVHHPDATMTKTGAVLDSPVGSEKTFDEVGDQVTYTFVITNTGNVLLYRDNFSDTMPGVTLTGCDAPVPTALAHPSSHLVGAQDLPAGWQLTCRATYKVVQRDLNNGFISNTALVEGGDSDRGLGIQRQATETLTADLDPRISLTKSVDKPQATKVGEVLTYTMVAENTGNVTLNGVRISEPLADAILLGCTGPDGAALAGDAPISLDPGKAKTCRWQYAVTQANVDAGSITNTATVMSVTPANEPVVVAPSTTGVQSNPQVVPIASQPELTVAKTVREKTFAAVGDILTYDISVTNTGNVSLTNVVLTDDHPVESLTCNPAAGSTLASAQTMTCVVRYKVTQADLDAGTVDNTATATGTAPNGTTTSDANDVPATSTGIRSPKLEMTKTADAPQILRAGQIVTYSFEVRNTGNVKLTGISLADHLAGVTDLSCPRTELAAGDGMTCTAKYTVTQDDIDLAEHAPVTNEVTFINSATVTGIDTAGTTTTTDDVTTSADASATIQLVHDPQIGLVKTASPTTVGKAGDTVTYTFTVTNRGNMTLKTILLHDEFPTLDWSTLSCTMLGSTVDLAAVALAPGNDIVCTATATMLQSHIDGKTIPNTAMVNATSWDGHRAATATDDEVITATQSPSMTFSKEALTPTVSTVGETIGYRFTVTNTGNVTLHNTFIKEPKVSAATNAMPPLECTITAKDGTTRDGSGPVDLAPQETKVCTSTYTVTQADLDAGTIVNTASVQGSYVDGSISDEKSATVRAVTNAGISLVKTVAPQRVHQAGEKVTYSFTIKNTGTVTLTNIRLTDSMPNLSAYSCEQGVAVDAPLAPQEERHCTATTTATEAQMNMTTVDNTATVTADTPAGYAGPALEPARSTATWIPVHKPSISLVKSHETAENGPRYGALTDRMTYTFTVSNTGNIQVDQIRIVDPLIAAPVVCDLKGTTAVETIPSGQLTLGVGESAVCSAPYTITQADLDDGTITNRATASGIVLPEYGSDPVASVESSDLAEAIQSPNLSFAKTAITTVPVGVGDEASFTLVARNTGNVTLQDVTITEPGWLDMRSITCELKDAQGVTKAALPGPIAHRVAPNETVECVVVMVVDQAGFDLGIYSNTAYAQAQDSMGQPLSFPDWADQDFDDDTTELLPTLAAEATVPTLDPAPGLKVTKTADRDKVTATGDQIAYTIVAENTGNVTLYFGSLKESKTLSNLTCDQDPAFFTLAPGKKLTCTGSWATTLEEMDKGEVVNTAKVTATALTQENTPIVGEDTVRTPATELPKLVMSKTASTTKVNAAGQRVDYTLSVKNAGNVTVQFISVDEHLPGVTAVTCKDVDGVDVPLPATLVPGQQLICSTSYTVQQPDIDAGAIINSASAKGTTQQGTAVKSNEDTQTVLVDQTSGVTMTKTSPVTTVQKVGEVVPYTITVTNTGNVTLSNAAVTDAMLPSLSCTWPTKSGTLAPGEKVVCTGSFTSTHTTLESGKLSNTANFTSTDPMGATVKTDATSTITVVYNPKLALTKSVSAPTNWVAGQQITFTLKVTNVGNMDAYHVTAVDTMYNLSVLVCRLPDGTVVGQDLNVAFPPGASVDCTATYTVQQSDVDRGFIRNTATVIAKEATGEAFPQVAASAYTETKQSGVVALKKVASTEHVTKAGDVITYTFLVSNPGKVTLSTIEVKDQLPGLGNIECDTLTIAPAKTATCKATKTVTQSDMDKGTVLNTASVSALTPSNPVNPQETVTASSETVTVTADPQPSLKVVKDAKTSKVTQSGDLAQFVIRVTNDGNVTASDVRVNDPAPATITNCDRPAPITLAPGETVSCDVDYTTQLGDIDKQQILNVATADATTPKKLPFPQAKGTATIPAERHGELKLTKTPSTPTVDTVGQTIVYTFEATNVGNATLYGVNVSDKMTGLTNVTCAPKDLKPGETLTCLAQYRTTVADMNRGHIDNTATASGELLGGDPILATDDVMAKADSRVDVVQDPKLAMSKTAKVFDSATGEEVTSVDSRADRIEYAFHVTNAGNVTVTDIDVNDPFEAEGLTQPTCPQTWLDPGQSMTCSATYYATQPRMDDGAIVNKATVIGDDPQGSKTPTVAATATIPVQQLPSMKITKTADHTSITAAGEKVLYTIVGTNTGNVTLSVVQVLDETFAGRLTVDRDGTIPGMDCSPTIPTTLQPEEKVICRAWYTTTQADLDGTPENPYQLTNVAVMTAKDPFGKEVPPAQAEETIQTMATFEQHLTKTTDKSIVASIGEKITYTFSAKNMSNVSLYDVRIVDPLPGLGPITCDRPMPGTLEPMTTMTCTATYVVGVADIDRGFILNTATMTSKKPDGQAMEDSVSSTRIETVQSPKITLTNVPDVPSVDQPGDQVGYTFTATNEGNTSLTDVVINVPHDGLTKLVCKVSGQPITAAAIGQGVAPDPSPKVSLKPGEKLTCFATYDTRQADLDAGAVSSSATVTANYPRHAQVPVDPTNPESELKDVAVDSPVPPASSSSQVPVVQTATMSLSKTASTTKVTHLGQKIPYTFVVGNTGNVTMVVTEIVDNLPNMSVVSCEPQIPARVAPGEKVTCTAEYTTVQADVDAGVVTNSATVKAATPDGKVYESLPASAVVPVDRSFSASLKKTASVGDVNGNGKADEFEIVTYTITGRNTGTTTLSDVVVHDAMLTDLSCSPALPATLAPGQTITCTGTHVVTHEEAKSNSLVNSAKLTARQLSTSPEGSSTQPTTVEADAQVMVDTTPTVVLANTGVSWSILEPRLPAGTIGEGLPVVAGWALIAGFGMGASSVRAPNQKRRQ